MVTWTPDEVYGMAERLYYAVYTYHAAPKNLPPPLVFASLTDEAREEYLSLARSALDHIAQLSRWERTPPYHYLGADAE